jgi:sortase (surface protein transpeptidase)
MKSDQLKKDTKLKALIAGLLGVAVALALGSFLLKPTPVATPLMEPVSATTTISGPILPTSVPMTLRIPKLSLETSFVTPLGLAENGEVAVPDSYTEVGWYKHSPTPGALGPAVILGHVDSYAGPAVFFSLGQLEPGDDVYVDREDGTTAHFKIETLERPKQTEFPTERVYGNTNYAGLRLITCSGIYVRGNARYTHNLIVYARLVE